jgi:hypothetical protein
VDIHKERSKILHEIAEYRSKLADLLRGTIKQIEDPECADVSGSEEDTAA